MIYDDKLTLEESSLEYSLFCAENNLIRSLALIDNKAKYVTEASEYQILNESLLDVMRKYMNQVVISISKAFQKIKQTIADKEVASIKKLVADNQKLLQTDFVMLYPDNFEYADLTKWENVFNTITNNFKEFTTADYNGWKTQKALETPEDYIKNNYSQLSEMGDPKQPLSVNLHNEIFKPGKGVNVNSTLVNSYVDFINNYEDQIKKIAAQIDKINNSNKNIDTYLSSIVQAKTEESYIGSERLLSLLAEAGENEGDTSQQPPAKINTNVENKFRDASDPTGEKAKNNSQSVDRKYIVNFFKANTQVLSAEMKVCNEIRKCCQKTIKNYIKLKLKANGKTQPKNNEENQNQEQNNQGVATVDTRV